jgi:hypothetical protein
MGVDDALGLSRRPGRVVDVGVMARSTGESRVGHGPGRIQALDVHDLEGEADLASKEGKGGGAGEDGPGAGIPEHVGDPLGRMGGLQGHVELARLQDAENRGDEQPALLEGEGDWLGSATAASEECVRDAVGDFVELVVGEGVGPGLDGEPARVGGDLLFEAAVDGLIYGGPIEDAKSRCLGPRRRRGGGGVGRRYRACHGAVREGSAGGSTGSRGCLERHRPPSLHEADEAGDGVPLRDEVEGRRIQSGPDLLLDPQNEVPEGERVEDARRDERGVVMNVGAEVHVPGPYQRHQLLAHGHDRLLVIPRSERGPGRPGEADRGRT